MTSDPRAALSALISALEAHFAAAAVRRGEGDPLVLAAYRELAEAFEDYDDALLDAFDEVTPLEVFHGEEEFDDDDIDDELEDVLVDDELVDDELVDDELVDDVLEDELDTDDQPASGSETSSSASRIS
jgi:hypothetical protein